MKNFETGFGRRAAGFTLVELMIVAAVVAILAAIALPMYKTNVQQSQRTDAKDALLNLASRMERYFTLNNTYVSSSSPALAGFGYSASLINASGQVGLGSGSTPDYYMSITAATASGYTLTAVPNGYQSTDTCGTYTLDNFGNQGNTGNSTATSSCW